MRIAFAPMGDTVEKRGKGLDQMDMTDQDYGKLVNEKAKASPVWKNMLWAFVVGGLICCVGQAFQELYQGMGLNQRDAGTAVTITLVLIAAVLTGLDVYEKLAKRAGAGTLVPVTGFANSVVAPAMEFKSEGFITGMAAKMFTIAGPVIVFGIGASVIYGLILQLIGMGTGGW